MQKINRKIFVILLLSSLLLTLPIWQLVPSSHAAPAQPLTLHSQKPLVPIHMDGPALQPVHMHSMQGIVPIAPPVQYTLWHELYPTYCQEWNHTSWLDMNQNMMLDAGDQIDMTNAATEEVRWYHVDRVTMTMFVSTLEPVPEPEMYVEFKGSYIPEIQPSGSSWHGVWPIYSGLYHIINWQDTGKGNTGYLGVCDSVMFAEYPGVWWHVDDYATDLILNEKIMDPKGTYWNELHPQFGNVYNITGWEDNGDGRLSPKDTVTLDPGSITPYAVTDVTLTLFVSLVANPAQTMYIEFTGGFQHLYEPKTNPMGTWWYEAYPDYGLEFQIIDWIDNCNGVLSYCDNITLADMTGFPMQWHVEELAIDITVQQPVHDVSVVSVTPLFASVFQGWPNPVTVVVSNDGDFTETFTVDCKYNGSHVTTSPITVTNLAPKATTTLTFCWVTKNVPLGVYTIFAYANPVPGESIADQADNNMTDGTVTILAPPPFYWKEGFCDYAPSGVPDFDQKQWGTYNWTDAAKAWSHCGPVAVANSLWWLDSEFEPAKPPVLPPAISDGFPLVSSYATMPPFWDDHDPLNVPWLVEHLAYLMDTDGRRTGLVHSGTNVVDMEAGLAQYLSWTGVNPKGDVNGDGIVNMTDVWIVGNASGTNPGMAKWNMSADIWPVTLGWPNRGVADNKIDVNDVSLVALNINKTGLFYERTVNKPDFRYVEQEVEKCEDVVLLIGYWYYSQTPPYWHREGGHYLTVAGVNSQEMKIAVSDPCYDAFENQLIAEGRVPIPHAHPAPEPPYVTHNNAAYVSHDIYNVANISQIVPQPNPNGTWVLLNYPNWRPTPPYFAVVESAVITSPLGIHDVAVTNVTSMKTVICRGFTGNITAKVENQGNFTENFNVTLYANTTIIEKQLVTLTSGNTKTLLFVWNTTGFAKGNYTIKAIADTVSGESDTLDNTFRDKWIIVSIVGDVTGQDGSPPDNKVDMVDLWEEARNFGIDYPDPRFKPNFDIDNNGKIDMVDLWLTAREFGKIDP